MWKHSQMLGELKVQLTERGEAYYVLVNIHSCCYFFCLFLDHISICLKAYASNLHRLIVIPNTAM